MPIYELKMVSDGNGGDQGPAVADAANSQPDGIKEKFTAVIKREMYQYIVAVSPKVFVTQFLGSFIGGKCSQYASISINVTFFTEGSIGILTSVDPIKFAMAGSFSMTYMQIIYSSINYGFSKLNFDNIYSHALSGSIVAGGAVCVSPIRCFVYYATTTGSEPLSDRQSCRRWPGRWRGTRSNDVNYWRCNLSFIPWNVAKPSSDNDSPARRIRGKDGCYACQTKTRYFQRRSMG